LDHGRLIEFLLVLQLLLPPVFGGPGTLTFATESETGCRAVRRALVVSLRDALPDYTIVKDCVATPKP
jgi:hypothetical protein